MALWQLDQQLNNNKNLVALEAKVLLESVRLDVRINRGQVCKYT